MLQLPPVYFEKLLESSLDIVIAVDRKGQITFYNDGASQTLGYTPTEMKGKRKLNPQRVPALDAVDPPVRFPDLQTLGCFSNGNIAFGK